MQYDGQPIFYFKILKSDEYYKEFDNFTNGDRSKLETHKFLIECEHKGIIKMKSIDFLLIDFQNV